MSARRPRPDPTPPAEDRALRWSARLALFLIGAFFAFMAIVERATTGHWWPPS